MGPKKAKGKKDKKKDDKPPAMLEVEKTFYELTIADLNRKLVRMKGTIETLEIKNEELENQLKTLDDDRADVISYVKKTLNNKTEEAQELKEKVAGLEEIREIETKQFKEKVQELNKEFVTMREQLTSEVKLLSGKLNSLEEFRAMREDLMKKFETQDQDFQDQELKYKRVIYESEKKFVIGKDKLKKEMEARLLQLAQDFQDATEIRIAASTHRVIRENIAINNELDAILSNQSKLSEVHEVYRDKERSARLSLQLAEADRDKAVEKNIIQTKIIEKLSLEYNNMKKDAAKKQKVEFDFQALNKKLELMADSSEKMALKIRILEQNLHAASCDKNKVKTDAMNAIEESTSLRQILRNTRNSLKAALKLQEWKESDPSRELEDRKSLLNNLLEILNGVDLPLGRAPSVATIPSMSYIYKQGDLGFVPPSADSPKPSMPRRRTIKIIQDKEMFIEPAPTLKSESSEASLDTLPEMELAQTNPDEKASRGEDESEKDDDSISEESQPEEEEQGEENITVTHDVNEKPNET